MHQEEAEEEEEEKEEEEGQAYRGGWQQINVRDVGACNG